MNCFGGSGFSLLSMANDTICMQSICTLGSKVCDTCGTNCLTNVFSG